MKAFSLLALLLLCSVVTLIFLVSLVVAVEDSWTILEPMPTARKGFGVAVVEGKIYVIGGSTANGTCGINQMYNPATNTWTTKAPMPVARTRFGISVFQNKIYIFGGLLENNDYESFTAITQVYDTTSNTWENRSSMPTPRSDLCVNTVNDKIYLIGGLYRALYPNYSTSNVTELYDPETDEWATKASIPQSVAKYASAAVDNKIYIFGGVGGLLCFPWNDYNYIYDVESDAWSTGEPVPVGFDMGAAGATTGEYAQKRIYVFGGFIDSSYDPCNLTQIYDPEENMWTVGAQMLTPHAIFDVAVVNDELYVIGGVYENIQGATDSIEKYTPVGYISEFPSWIILPLLLTVALAGILYRKRLIK